MDSVNVDLLKKRLKEILGRDVVVDKLRGGKFMCRYMNYGAPALSLVGATEEEAYQKLYVFLEDKKVHSTSEV